MLSASESFPDGMNLAIRTDTYNVTYRLLMLL